MSQEKRSEAFVVPHGWRIIKNKVLSREGHEIDVSGDSFILPLTTKLSGLINLKKISNLALRWAVKSYVIDRLERVSLSASSHAFKNIWWKFLKHQDIYKLTERDVKSNLISLIEHAISTARSKHKLHELYEPIRWYIWCAERYQELGFCPAFALELDGMTIPGGPKGEAVRMGDPDCGPLHRSLELPLLVNALKNDNSTALAHLQQRAAVSLSIALGRNPANLTYLRGEDLKDITPQASQRCYVIKMPRIKKRLLNPRDDALDEYLDPQFARHILALISRNRSISTSIDINGKRTEIPKPLFINLKKNSVAVATKHWSDVYNMTSADICDLLQDFVARHEIISPITGQLLQISVRRMRYTLATNLAAEGISKRELARILDHTDTQHVHVYFEMAGNIVKHLDKAAAKTFSNYFSFFKGSIVESDEVAINGTRKDKHLAFQNENSPEDQVSIGVCGEKNLCHLDPPYSCYLCPKFQPYMHADHEHVLECLLENREERIVKYEKGRLGVQLDEVIAAVAQVVKICVPEDEND